MKQYLGTYQWYDLDKRRTVYIDVHYDQKDGVFESVALEVDPSPKKDHKKCSHFHTHSQYIFERYPGMSRVDNLIERLLIERETP
jgi:hypothetical protein